MKKFLLIAIVSGFTLTSCATRVVTTTRPANKVVVVKTPPKGHRIVRVNGQRYYYWNNTYYRKTSRGYTVVRI